MKDRDMYYGGYGYSGFTPIPGMTDQVPNIGYGQVSNNSNNYVNSQFNDIIERIERLERRVKRLDQRLTRLETPYANNNEPDNNMYMM